MRRADSLLAALLEREARPAVNTCTGCSPNQIAQWRCVDCTSTRLLCRACMRQAHQDNPLHRIECWAGSHFRPAALWEVGVYVLVGHHVGEAHCGNLLLHMSTLASLQLTKDHNEQLWLKDRDRGNRGDNIPYPAAPTEKGEQVDEKGEEHNFDDEESDNGSDEEGEVSLPEGFDGYLPAASLGLAAAGPSTAAAVASPAAEATAPSAAAAPSAATHVAPRQDGMNNHFVRIVHTNGMHHIALVTCECRGPENVILDIMYCRLVPTSFKRVQTLFTNEVLDNFRLANLELKATAYQYFQMLRRRTVSSGWDKVPNLYHELRRLSRAWRWMKKLKWAGYGDQSRSLTEIAPGELGNFCPTCPQPGVNVSHDWEQDPNQCEYIFEKLFNS